MFNKEKENKENDEKVTILEEKVKEAGKAVYEKNKTIGDLFNKNNDLMQEIENKDL